MAITLGAITLPDGLYWEDEHSWSGIAQSTNYSLSGRIIIERSAPFNGRNITLVGQSNGVNHTAWITRADLITLRNTLATSEPITLTLHSGEAFSVLGRHHESSGAVEATALPKTNEFFPSNPQPSAWYNLNAVRLITV